MFSDKTIARIVGVLFIVATATAIAGGLMIQPAMESDYLVEAASSEGRLISGVILELMLVASVIAIPVMIYPVLRRRNEALALSYVGARTLEGVLLLAASVSALLVLSVSRSYQAGGTQLDAVGETLLASRDWTYLIGSMMFLGVSAVILNTVLTRARLVPAWLSLWGLIAGGLILMRGLLELYGVDLSGLVEWLFAGPIALQEMVFAVWLIVKGFDGARRDTAMVATSVAEPERVLTP